MSNYNELKTADTISTVSIRNGAVTSDKLAAAVTNLVNLGISPKITSINVTDINYTVLDDTAVSLTGGYIRINGSSFTSGCQVLINNTPAISVSFVNDTRLHVQVPSNTAGTYSIYVTNPDGGVAIVVNGLTYSATPSWVTGTDLGQFGSGSPISLQLSATSATTYTLTSGSVLPTGLTLSSGGLLSGTVTVGSSTLYNFSVTAIDAELQDSPRTFSLTVAILAVGQQTFTTMGQTAWTVPANVTSICVVCVGGGGGGCSSTSGGSGGGGGDLRWMNNISVTPGEILNVFVGTNGALGGTEGGTPGGRSELARQNLTTIVIAAGGGGGRQSTSGGNPGPKGGTSSTIGGNIGGGNGGGVGILSTTASTTSGGGGAGGYSGNGGDQGTGFAAGSSGQGGGGGGGGGQGSASTGGNGGGVGLLGEGASGFGGGPGAAGEPGSTNATGLYYGGGGRGSDASGFNSSAGQQGAVRIIWGPNRAFPSTNTADQ